MMPIATNGLGLVYSSFVRLAFSLDPKSVLELRHMSFTFLHVSGEGSQCAMVTVTQRFLQPSLGVFGCDGS